MSPNHEALANQSSHFADQLSSLRPSDFRRLLRHFWNASAGILFMA